MRHLLGATLATEPGFREEFHSEGIDLAHSCKEVMKPSRSKEANKGVGATKRRLGCLSVDLVLSQNILGKTKN